MKGQKGIFLNTERAFHENSRSYIMWPPYQARRRGRRGYDHTLSWRTVLKMYSTAFQAFKECQSFTLLTRCCCCVSQYIDILEFILTLNSNRLRLFNMFWQRLPQGWSCCWVSRWGRFSVTFFCICFPRLGCTWKVRSSDLELTRDMSTWSMFRVGWCSHGARANRSLDDSGTPLFPHSRKGFSEWSRRRRRWKRWRHVQVWRKKSTRT